MAGLGYRYSTPRTHPAMHHPGYTDHHPGYTSDSTARPVSGYTGSADRRNMVVGLISVDQLSLDAQISGSLTITEGYNLAGIGRINNHFVIPGNE